MSFLRYALFTVPGVLLLGTLSGTLAGSGSDNAWFEALAKPDIMPPGWAFAIVWPILYVLLGLALAMLLHARGAKGRDKALPLFVLGLILNFAWPPVFFAWHKVDIALSILAAMIILTVALIVLMWRIRPVAAALLLPYLAWLMFAVALNFQIVGLNPGAENLVPGATVIDIPV
jgi:tryptophan-rich sensory protein